MYHFINLLLILVIMALLAHFIHFNFSCLTINLNHLIFLIKIPLYYHLSYLINNYLEFQRY